MNNLYKNFIIKSGIRKKKNQDSDPEPEKSGIFPDSGQGRGVIFALY